MDTTPYIKIKEKCEKVFKGKYGIYDEDVIYDTMVSIILQFKKNQGNIRNLNAWLNGAIHHHYCSYLTHKNRNKETFHYDYFIHDKVGHGSDFAENRLDVEIVMGEIEQLEPPYQEIVRMRLIEGFSHKEIADEMKIKESTIRKYYSRSLKKIMEVLKPLSHFVALLYLIK